MTAKVRFQSDVFEAIHAAAEGLHRAGAINKATMRQFDETCLTQPPPLEPAQIKRIRERNHVSQPVFARYLNTSESTVQKWEAGAKCPSGMALRLSSVIEKHGLKVPPDSSPQAASHILAMACFVDRLRKVIARWWPSCGRQSYFFSMRPTLRSLNTLVPS